VITGRRAALEEAVELIGPKPPRCRVISPSSMTSTGSSKPSANGQRSNMAELERKAQRQACS